MKKKLSNKIREFMEDSEKYDLYDLEEANKELNDFLNHFNNGRFENEDESLVRAYELLEKAENAKSENQARKYAKEAYELCPDCFDAVMLLASLEDNPDKMIKILDDGLKVEKERLRKAKYLEKRNTENIFEIFEILPYVKGLYSKAQTLAMMGKMKQSKVICEELLQLDEEDTLGVRYLLFAILANLEDEKELLKLYKKYHEENFMVLFPVFALNYKLGNENKAKEYFDRVNKANPNFVKFINGIIKNEKKVDNLLDDDFSHGDLSEIVMYVNRYTFLLVSMPLLGSYIEINTKKKK